MIKSWLLFLPLISAAYVYEVHVNDAKDLQDEDTDFLWITNHNDVYVEIHGYGENNASKMETTSIITSATPQWPQSENYTFDDELDGNGAYSSFLFKLYDSDEVLGSNINPPDFLGEAGPVYTSSITDCTDEFAVELEVSEGGTLMVIITKSGCDEDEDGDEDEDQGGDTTSTSSTTSTTTRKPSGSKGAALMEVANSEPEGCLVGDIQYQDGDTIGHIGYTCLEDGNQYIGTESMCADGEVIESEYTGDCGEEYAGSSCCQQGAPGTFGGAVCITGVCEEYEDEDGGEEDGSCMVGDMKYSSGQTIGTLGDRCIDDVYYEGTTSVCVEGVIEDFPYYGDCGGEMENGVCCPSSTATMIIGGVECVEESECEEEVEPDSGEDCLVGDIMYQHGQTTGHEGRTCIDEQYYSGTGGVCLDGDITRFDRFGDCSEENPGSICCQQGAPDTYGAAVCVEAELCVEYDGDGEFPGFGTTEQENGGYDEDKKSGEGKATKGKEKGQKPK